MEKWEIAKDWCLQRIGNPYIYGATGKPCTPAYREARANQYPEYAAKIKKNCPRMSGKATTCQDCRWCDPTTGKGKDAYDCAQFTRWCMNAVGISLVSGANSQWKQTEWAEAGGIGTIPRDKLCLVYREDADGKKHHAGVYLGDGWIVHAKGHDYGVVKELLGNPRFTHWGIPVGLYGGVEHKTIKRGDQGAAVSEMQQLLNERGYSLKVDGKFGPKTESALKDFQAKSGLVDDGICGEDTWAALCANSGDSGAEQPVDGQDDGDAANGVYVPRNELETMRINARYIVNTLDKILDTYE